MVQKLEDGDPVATDQVRSCDESLRNSPYLQTPRC